MKIAIKKLSEEAIIPTYASDGAAGFDLYCLDDIVITSCQSTLIKTGLSVAIPKGYEVQIRPRSGLALRKMVTVLNSPGTIDSDYRGEIGIILINHSEEVVEFKKGDRVAQGVVAPVLRAEFICTDSLDETTRGSGGFGSTGN